MPARPISSAARHVPRRTDSAPAPRGAALSVEVPVVTRRPQMPGVLGLSGFSGPRGRAPLSLSSPFSMLRPAGPLLPALPKRSSTLTRSESTILAQPQNQRSLEELTSSREFKALTPGLQARALQSFAAAPNDPARTADLRRLLALPEFKALTSQHCAHALDVFDQTDHRGRERLVQLLQRQVNGKTAALDPDSQGVPLLERLSFLARGAMDLRFENLGETRSSMVASILDEVARPGHINQGSHDTCTVASMQYMVCETNPGEYVRLMQGLLRPAGDVKLRDGTTLTRVADSIPSGGPGTRSASERVFQSAMMELSNGDMTYSNVTDRSRLQPWNVGKSGLNPPEEERGLSALFGHPFTAYVGEKKERNGAQMLEKLRGRSPGNTLINLEWGSGYHAVVVTKVENGRVFFRNPLDPTTSQVGTTFNNPPRRLEVADANVHSMTEADFAAVVTHVFVD